MVLASSVAGTRARAAPPVTAAAVPAAGAMARAVPPAAMPRVEEARRERLARQAQVQEGIDHAKL